ncbi:MAG: carbohydrate porin [Proteobacteria bacterium]|nr:carbohydrate porin [Pseudomonadota bacterium]
MRWGWISAGLLLGLSLGGNAFAAGLPDWLSLHAQSTFVLQYHPQFRSPYQGANSLKPQSVGAETFDATLFAGIRLWHGASLYVNPEIDQGFGLSNTLGTAGFLSGEAYKVGDTNPYFRLQRLFIRQSIDLGGAGQKIDDDANQFGGTRSANNLVLTAGKFSVGDVFDTNQYAHDPRGDFLNWALLDAGAFDYAADAWGYASGVAIEWTQGWWTLRFGAFNLSKQPNGKVLESAFGQFETVGEAEERHTLFGHDGKVKLLGFINRGRMGSYDDALALANATGAPPDTSLVRRYASRPGGEVNIEQGISDNLGVFLRASVNDGSKEAYEFTEINRSVSAGVSLKGASWGRPDDTIALGAVVNGLSPDARSYFAAGGMGILIGDGRLPHYGTEDIVEAYYSARVTGWLSLSADYQLIEDPAYNRDRGPVSALALRLHAQI